MKKSNTQDFGLPSMSLHMQSKAEINAEYDRLRNSGQIKEAEEYGRRKHQEWMNGEQISG